MYICTYIYVHINISTYIHIYIFTYIQKYIYANMHIYIYTYIHIYTYTCIHIYIYTCLHVWLRTLVYYHIIRHSRIQYQRGISKLASLAQDPLQRQSKEQLCGSCCPRNVIIGAITSTLTTRT